MHLKLSRVSQLHLLIRYGTCLFEIVHMVEPNGRPAISFSIPEQL